MTRLFLITLLLLSSGPAYAEWVKVSESDDAGKQDSHGVPPMKTVV